jgi:hypothetical protein
MLLFLPALPLHSKFKKKLLKNPEKLANNLIDKKIWAVIVSGTMTRDHCEKYTSLTRAGTAAYPPQEAQFHNTIPKTFSTLQGNVLMEDMDRNVQQCMNTKVLYTGRITNFKKAHGSKKGDDSVKTLELLGRRTAIAHSNKPTCYSTNKKGFPILFLPKRALTLREKLKSA